MDELLRWFGRPASNGNGGKSSWWTACCFNRGDGDEEEEQRKRLSRGRRRKDSKVMRTAMFLEHGSSKELRDSYVIEHKIIGKGGFGTVRKAALKDSPHLFRAIKEVRKRNPKLQRTVHREIGVLRRLDHPNICRLYETFEDTKYIYLVMEFIEGRELFEELQEDIMNGIRFDEHRAACIMHQVFGALHYCHGHEIIHRDLKPENIMVCKQEEGESCTTPIIKIIDFGLAVLTKAEGYWTHQLEGTEAYLAPEAKRGNCLPASDMWSTGVILHIILLGRFPPEPPDLLFPERSATGLSSKARNLLEGLLDVVPELRISASGAMQHPWTLGNYDGSPMSPGRHDEEETELLTEGVSSFIAFCRSQRLHQAALTALATQLSCQQVAHLCEQFSAMDTDGNGVISKMELLNAVQRAPPDGVTDLEAWVQATFDEVDTDGSGEIEFTEWQAIALRNMTDLSDEAMRVAFRVLDSDKSGTLSFQDIARVLKDSPARIKASLSEFDLDGDGEMDFEEFRAMLLRVTTPKGSRQSAPLLFGRDGAPPRGGALAEEHR